MELSIFPAAVEDSVIAPASVPDDTLHTTGGILRDACAGADPGGARAPPFQKI